MVEAGDDEAVEAECDVGVRPGRRSIKKLVPQQEAQLQQSAHL